MKNFKMQAGGKTKVRVIHSENNTEEEIWSEDPSGNRANLKQILKPMLYVLAMAGNYSFSDINSQGRKSKLIIAFSKVYRFCIFAILSLYFAKSVAAIFYLPSQNVYFQFNLLCTVWITYNICTFMISLKSATAKFGHYEKAFQFWDQKIVPEFQELNIKYPVAKMKRGVIIAIVTAFSLTIFNTVGVIVQVYVSEDVKCFYNIPFECKPTIISVVLIIILIAGLAYYTTAIFAVTLSILLREAFKSFNKCVSKICEEQESTVPKTFKKIRLLHLNLSKLISDFDQDLGWFYGIFTLFSTGLNVFTLYQIMRTSLTTFQLFLYLLWLLSATSSIGVTSVCAALVHEAAHAPLDSIYYLNVQDFTVEKLAQLNMFLSKLTGTQIGFSTCGLLIINKEFILTIAGVFLTYFVVLYTL